MLASFLTFHFVSRPSSAGCHTIFSFLLFYAFISLEYSFFTKIFLHTLRIICAFSLRRWISVVCLPFFARFRTHSKRGQNLFQTTGNLRIFIVAKSLLFWFVELNAVVPALMMLCYFLLLVFFRVSDL